MKSSKNSNAWLDEDLCALKICYDAKVPLKLMAQFFGKSENSISKMLTRSNIRPVGSHARGKRPLALQSRFTTKEEITALIKSAKDLPSFKPDDQTSAYYLTQQKAHIRSRMRLHEVKPPPLEAWTSLTHLIEEFKRKGINIFPTNDPSLLRMGYGYMINGAPKKSSDLLRIANTERLAQRLPRIFIEGITDNN